MNKEEEKLLNAIHNNYKKAHTQYKQDKQLTKIQNEKQEKAKAKKERRKNIILGFGLISLVIAAVFILKVSSDDFMNDCLNAGNSQFVCERAL